MMTERRVARIARTRLVDEAAQALQDAILNGRLAPGERLLEDRLASQLGISRTPLREALRKLEELGLVTVSKSRGVQVAHVDLQEACDLYEIREVLDGLAARRAARRITPAQLDELRTLLAEMDAALAEGKYQRWSPANVQFHEAIARASGNARVLRLLPAIRMSILMFFPTLVVHPDRLRAAHEEHHAIFEAIAAGEATRAEELIRAHCRNSRALLEQELSGPAQD